MIIKVKDKLIFSSKLLWIERDASGPAVTFVFDGGVKLAVEKVDFDLIRSKLTDTNDPVQKSVDSMFKQIFG